MIDSPKKLRSARISRKNDEEETTLQEEKELNRFGITLIKVVGIAGTLIGLIALTLLYYWFFKKIF
ncbi:MAG: hypothetical protein ACOVMR_07560 [Flavobacteriales bacterium]|jgi:hypothetical protein